MSSIAEISRISRTLPTSGWCWPYLPLEVRQQAAQGALRLRPVSRAEFQQPDLATELKDPLLVGAESLLVGPEAGGAGSGRRLVSPTAAWQFAAINRQSQTRDCCPGPSRSWRRRPPAGGTRGPPGGSPRRGRGPRRDRSAGRPHRELIGPNTPAAGPTISASTSAAWLKRDSALSASASLRAMRRCRSEARSAPNSPGGA